MDLKARMEDWPSLRPVVLHVYETPVPKIGADARTLHTGNYYVWLLRQGEVMVENHGRTTRGRVGDWVIAHPGPRHQRFSPDAVILSVQFQARWPDGQPLFDSGLSLAFPSVEAPLLEERALALKAAAAGVLPSDPMAIRGTPISLVDYFAFQHRGSAFLLELFRELERRGLTPSRVGQTDERLLAVLRRLDGWPLDLPLDWPHIARTSGLSADRLARLFTGTFGLSPRRYFAGRRYDYARRLVGRSGTPIKVIAADLGFTSLADFSAWFRREHGCSPSAYRQRPAVSTEI